jgi:trehalose-6-phosphate synthase
VGRGATAVGVGEAGLVIVSHRGPGGPGGVAPVLDAVVAHRGGVWIAADGEARPYLVVRVPLTREEESGYYLGYAVGGLWPLLHGFADRAEFRDRDWRQYVRVNARFARAAAECAAPGATVWVHDVQLALVPGLLRRLRPDVRVGLFWHVPWPAPEVFRLCPQAGILLTAMAEAHLVGFHTASYARNFRACRDGARDRRPAAPGRRGSAAGPRGHRVGVFPLGVDFAAISRVAASPGTARRMRRLARLLGVERRIVGLGAERLDYTKGILQRLAALRLLRDRDPALARRLVYIQVAVPSRTEVPAYRRLAEDVRREALPLVRAGMLRLIHRRLDFDTLVALYRMADFALVSPLCDGMNLVAKEYVASRTDGDGVLILSQGAGAAEELRDALLVSPLHTDGMADAIRQALTMPAEERRRRMARLRRRVATRDVRRWAADFLRVLAERA